MSTSQRRNKWERRARRIYTPPPTSAITIPGKYYLLFGLLGDGIGGVVTTIHKLAY
jgi:hypothetical protein